MFYYTSSHKNLSLLDYKYSNSLDSRKNLFIDLYNNLYYLENEYPNFFNWYKNLFNEDYTLKPDREIFLCKYVYDTAGIIILKKTKSERKICTLRVKENYQKNGIAKKLIKAGIKWLGDSKPFVTVSEYRNEQFKHLFKHFGFNLKDKINCYNFDVKEFFYNDIVDDTLYENSNIINKKNIILHNEVNNFERPKKKNIKKIKLENQVIYYHFNFNKEINSNNKFNIVKYSDILHKLSNKTNYYDYNIVSEILNNKNEIIGRAISDFKKNVILKNSINIFYNFESKREIKLENQEYNYFNEIKNNPNYIEYSTFLMNLITRCIFSILESSNGNNLISK